MNIDCVFCAIVLGKAPAHKIFEDEYTIAFLNRYQLNKGHTLVIPRLHYQDIFDIPGNILSQIYLNVQMVCQLLQKNMGYKNLNIWQSNGSIAGQEIDHLHVHILPRLAPDELGFYQQMPRQPGRDEMEQVARQLRGE